MALSKTQRRNRIKRRTRASVQGTSSTPRLSVYRSNKEFYAQLVDDESGKTIAAASSLKTENKGNKKDQAVEVAKTLVEAAKSAGVETVKFDRNGYLYHGRVKAFADAAREAGLKF